MEEHPYSISGSARCQRAPMDIWISPRQRIGRRRRCVFLRCFLRDTRWIPVAIYWEFTYGEIYCEYWECGNIMEYIYIYVYIYIKKGICLFFFLWGYTGNALGIYWMGVYMGISWEYAGNGCPGTQRTLGDPTSDSLVDF